MTIGNTPNPASFPGQNVTPTETKRSADVDPNKLLLMLPDLDKRVREFSKLTKNVEKQADQHVTDSQLKELENFAKALISEPNLPPGSKAALEKWISDVIAQTATPEAQAEGDAAETQNATTQPGQKAPADGAQTPKAAVRSGQAPGGDGTQANQTKQSSTTTQKAVIFGADPNLLLADNPDAPDPSVKTLGKLASAMAKAQGGTLTPEQVTLLKHEAEAMFSATPSTLTDADTAVLLSFISQLEEYPTAEEPNGTADPNKASSKTAPDGTQKSQTRSAKAPDTTNLEMNELGLDDAVQELGKQAMSYVQGNNGKISEREAKQLTTAAEELIAGGADGDDLQALQKFIKELATFPRSGQSAASDASPLLLTQPGINPKMITLGQFANSMVKAQNGSLTEAEVTMLKGMAEQMMSELSPEDQALLKTWLGTLASTKTAPPPKQNPAFDPAMLFGPMPKHNPYMSPGIMAMLAPILAEIARLNNDIIRQGSKLKQGMMKLLVAMAKEAFNFAIQAGQAKAAQLQNDAVKYMSLGISQSLQAGMTMVMHGVEQKQQGKFKKEAKDAKIDSKNRNWAAGVGEDPKPSAATLKNRQTRLANAELHAPDNPRAQAKLLKKDAGEDMGKLKRSEKGEIMATTSQRMQYSGASLGKTLVGQFGGAVDSFINAAFTFKNIEHVMNEATANAHKDLISQLMQLVTQTIQTASDEMAAGQKNFDSFVQLYKDFANTITQGMYRNG